MADNKTAEYIVSLIDKFSASADNIVKSNKNLTENLNKSADHVRGFQRTLTDGMAGLKNVAYMLGEVGISFMTVKESLEQGIQVTESFEDIKIKANLTSESLEKLSDSMFDMAKKWHMSVGDIASAAGSLPDEILKNKDAFDKTMEAALAFSKGARADLGTTLRATIPLVKSFHVGVNELPQAFDAVQAAAKKASMPVEDLLQALPRMSENAKLFGMDGVKGMKEVTTAVALLAQKTGDPALAIQQISTLMNKLTSKAGQDALWRYNINLGVVLKDARERHVNPFLNLISKITQNTYGYEHAIAEIIGGRGLMSAFISLNEAMRDTATMTETQNAIYNSAGTNIKAANDRMREFIESFTRAYASVRNLGAALGLFLIPGAAGELGYIADMLDAIAKALKTASEYVEPFIKLLDKMHAGRVIGGAAANSLPIVGPVLQGATALKNLLLDKFGPKPAGPSPYGALNLNAFPHRQHGGPVASGAAYVVGEAGPELFVPGMHGAIASTFGGGGSGGGSEQSIYRAVLAGTKQGIVEGLRDWYGMAAGGINEAAKATKAAYEGAGASVGGPAGTMGLGMGSPYAGGGGGWVGSMFGPMFGGGRGGRGGGGRYRSPRLSGPGPKYKPSARANQWMQFLTSDPDLHLSQEQAAGIVGNLSHESGGFTKYHEMGQPWERGGVGDAQWTGSRRREFEAWASANGLDPRSFEAQSGFMKHELLGKEHRSLAAVRQASSADEAAATFERTNERAGVAALSSRIYRARSIAANYHPSMGPHPLETALNFHARPTLDHSHIDHAISKAKELRKLLDAPQSPLLSNWSSRWHVQHALDDRFAGSTLQGE